MPGYARGIHVSGSYAYVADFESGIQVIDISNPNSPSIVGSCDTPGYAEGIHVSGSYAYVADVGSGIQVIDIFKPFTDVSYNDSSTITATVPTGFRPGTYNLHVTNNDGGHIVLRNAFTVYSESISCLSAGLNIFAYPPNVPQGYTSYDLILALGTEDEIIKIQRYDPNTETYWTTTYDPNGVPCGHDFNIVSGEGYLVYMKMAKSVPFSGSIVYPNISLIEGLNIVSIPSVSLEYTSYDLLLYLGSPDEILSIQRFNKGTGAFETTAYYFGRPSGTKFNIINGEAYQIYMKVAKQMDTPH